MAEASSDAVTSVSCHLSGITRLCFSPDGSTIFTGGSDCLVRIHRADDPDSEPGFHDDHTDAITSLSCSNSNLYTSSLDNIARIFSHPSNDFQGFLTRSSGVPIRWISVDKAGERVAVCGDDLLVKIVHAHDTSRVSLLSDNTKAVRSATWDPSGRYLITASCDGRLRIYDMSGSTPLLLKIMEGIIASGESDSHISCYAAWHPSGSYFATPTRTNEIGIISREGWVKQHTYSSDGPKTPIGELAWSANGKYLASAAGSRILVWSTESRTVIARYDNPEGAVSGLSFSPNKNFLAFTSLEGTFSRWTNPIPSSFPDPVMSEAAAAKKLDRLLDDEFGEEADEELEDKGDDLFGEGDDWIEDDDGLYAVDDGEKARGGRTEVVNVTKAQDGFAPGSTTMKNKKRYLAFNMIGAVDVTDQETHNVVNVEFHDKAARRGYHFQDHNKYTMASLGEQGIVYAAPGQEGQASLVYYRPYDSWASQSDWTISLLPGEDALCVTAGGGGSDGMGMGSVVVASSKGFVRFLSSSGIQRYMWRMGEEAVSMAAGKDMVILVHREGGTSLDGCQNLRYSLIDLNMFELVQEGRVPLPRKTTLAWIGFTSDGAPAIYDSTGLLSVLDRFRRPGQARWVPILDSATLTRREGKTETYWPVGVTATHFTCVILKGSEKEPWFPRPLIQEMEMHMPLLNMDNQQGKLEESMVRGELQLSLLQDTLGTTDDVSDVEISIRAREVALDKELLQLVQGACKADSLQRALDVTRLMHNTATIDAAAKVAAFYHLPGLQEHIQGVKTDMELKRMKECKAKRSSMTANGHSNGNGSSTKQFSDFAPRPSGARRSFGGVQRDSTPAASGRSETYIPETPIHINFVEGTPAPDDGEEDVMPGSPEMKRKRDEEKVEEFSAPIKKRAEEFHLSNGTAAKNPFAKKAVASNPFAKPAVAKPLDAIKSTSFFERVDNIESSGASKASARPKVKRDENKSPQGGKQMTLVGMKKPPPPIHQESTISTETEMSEGFEGTQMEESPMPVGVLEESHVQETLSPEPLDVEV